jgi:hypothetical protein
LANPVRRAEYPLHPAAENEEVSDADINGLRRLSAVFQVLLADRQVTPDEVEALITSVNRGGVTLTEAHALREKLAAHADAFAPVEERWTPWLEALPARLLPDVNVGAGATATASSPAPLPADAGAVHEAPLWPRQALFVDGATPDDPIQNGLGDCYLLAALSSLARDHAEPLQRDLIRANRDGTFTVRLFERTSSSGSVRPVEITVDGSLPIRSGSGERAYARSRNPAELWPSLVEKAYAKWKGGYAALVQGQPGSTLEALTGWRPRAVHLCPDHDPASVGRALKADLDAGRALTAMTHRHDEARYHGTGVYPHHVYSVLDVKEREGAWFIRLRNPLADIEPAGPQAPGQAVDGDFWLRAGDFVRLFLQVDSVGPG